MTKIENETQYQWAVDRVEELLPLVMEETPSTDPAFIELQLLTNLVADYSDEHYSIRDPSLVDILKLRMYELGLTQAALAKKLKVSASRVSKYLSGKTEPTLKVGCRMCQELNIPAEIVLGV